MQLEHQLDALERVNRMFERNPKTHVTTVHAPDLAALAPAVGDSQGLPVVIVCGSLDRASETARQIDASGQPALLWRGNSEGSAHFDGDLSSQVVVTTTHAAKSLSTSKTFVESGHASLLVVDSINRYPPEQLASIGAAVNVHRRYSTGRRAP